MNKNVVLVFILVVFIVGGLLFVYNPEPIEYKPNVEEEGVVCTMDAKLCPDGSYVGRSGPNCEFVCPTPENAAIEDGTI